MADANQDEVLEPTGESQSKITCRNADDLYTPVAKRTIDRLFANFLTQNRITAGELLHRPDLLDKLENTGMLVMHAIQKIAVAKASADRTPVAETIKTFNTILAELSSRAHTDRRGGVFPDIEAETFGKTAAEIAGQANAAYVMGGAIAGYLRDAKSWNDKVVRLARLMTACRREDAGGQLASSVIDGLIAEIVNSPLALQDILGPKENFGAALLALGNIFLGRRPSPGGPVRGADLLADFFATNELPATHAGIAARILADLGSVKRFYRTSIDDDLRFLRQISDLLAQGVGDHLSREDLNAAIETRSQRYTSQECLAERLPSHVPPDERLEWLCFADECIASDRSKYQLANLALHIVSSAKFINYFRAPQIPAAKRLQKLANLIARMKQTGFPETKRRLLTEIFDRTACDIAAQVRLFETIEASQGSPVDKALMLAQMFASGGIPEGKLAARAREVLIAYLSWPGFLAAYLEHKAKGGEGKLDAVAAAIELKELLQKIGIPPEVCCKSMAA